MCKRKELQPHGSFRRRFEALSLTLFYSVLLCARASLDPPLLAPPPPAQQNMLWHLLLSKSTLPTLLKGIGGLPTTVWSRTHGLLPWLVVCSSLGASMSVLLTAHRWMPYRSTRESRWLYTSCTEEAAGLLYYTQLEQVLGPARMQSATILPNAAEWCMGVGARPPTFLAAQDRGSAVKVSPNLM